MAERKASRPVFPWLLAGLWMIFVPGLASVQPAAAQARGTPSPQASGTIRGTVKDPSGLVVVSAVVTLEPAASTSPRTTITDEAGSFRFSGVAPENYTITIAALGFSEWKSGNVVVGSGENQPVSAVLQVAPASTKMDVGLTQHELATEQLKAEEKQRLLGVFPNYFISYEPNAAPLTAAQKFQLGWKTMFDPVTIASSAITAGIQQARNSYHEFGQGMEGYGKRFGADYVDAVNGIIIGGVLMQAVFHQDPRYFYKGTGSVRRRFLYAIATAFVCKGDNGHWQPDYSDVLGGLAAGEISTLYYPASSRTGLRLFHNVLLGFGGRAAGNLAQEFVFRKLTTHVPKTAARLMQPMLREGTPVSLISVEDLSAKTAGPIDFVLAHDIEVSGAVVATAGSKASGEVSYNGVQIGDGGAMQVGLKGVHLKVGNTEVPLRSSQKRGSDGALEYHRLEDSGRIAIELYVGENVALKAGQ
ncbi:MAG TPA: carboxypeptidase-like regulatory domain-containing protein [Bryobacteraceae bacterium]|nr:carboxypeptidase-like regulatory domain-containing protein [Bryobacteraceae bacterium]